MFTQISFEAAHAAAAAAARLFQGRNESRQVCMPTRIRRLPPPCCSCPVAPAHTHFEFLLHLVLLLFSLFLLLLLLLLFLLQLLLLPLQTLLLLLFQLLLIRRV